jgi:hypothetical protein
MVAAVAAGVVGLVVTFGKIGWDARQEQAGATLGRAGKAGPLLIAAPGCACHAAESKWGLCRWPPPYQTSEVVGVPVT